MPSVNNQDHEPPGRAQRAAPQLTLDDVVLRATCQRFAPATVLIDAAGDVRHLKGDLQGIMSLPDGRPVLQVMTLLRRELRPELARLIRVARESNLALSRPAPKAGGMPRSDAPALTGRWRSNRAISAEHAIRMSVQQVFDHSASPMLMVCFEKRPLCETLPPSDTEEHGGSTAALEEQLATTREHLYTVIEELETSNEEAQSLNEELQTANEELQSTNEELEASNEELQASNEELTTVNEELQVKSLEWQSVNAELEGIYSTVDFPLLAFDERGLLTRTNNAVQRQIGMGGSWLGRHASALPWPAGMPAIGAEIEQVQSEGRSHASELTNVGARDWVMRIMPRVNADGSRAGVLIQMEDCTELRSSQQAAMRSAAQLHQLVDRSLQLVCICDPAGRLQMANPEFERAHMVPLGSAADKLVFEVLPGVRAQSFREAQLEAMRTLAPVEMEEVLDVGGEQRSLLASYYPLLDADGAVSGVCYQALDITRRKRAEAALLAASSAQLAAEGMARTKSTFLANMSHEIRTPLNAVLGLTRITLQGDLTPAARDQLSKAHEAAQALTRILDDVLDFSKIEAGSLRFEQRPFSLNQVLRGVKSLFSANAQEKQIALAVDIPLGVPLALMGDPFRLTQVLNNLVSNAVKFTVRGEVRVGVAPSNEPGPEAGTCTLRFSVRDTGMGIKPEVRDSLFQAYTQGDASITRRFGGSGLGLAICQRLVHMMGGRIGVNSEFGQGSEFWFTATFDVAQEPDLDVAMPNVLQADGATEHEGVAIDRSQPSNGTQHAPIQSSRRLHVLLADDNALNQVVSRAVLERMGHDVTVVGDGAEALHEVSAQPAGCFDAVLMDVHMPVMDGLQATQRIRALPQGKGLPILALTAAALPQDRDACLAAGMDDHISKPLDPDRLVDALHKVANLRGLVQPTAQPEAMPFASSGTRQRSDGLPELPDFDIDGLLKRVQHNERLVWQLLEAFVEQEGVTADELERLLEARRFEEARLRTHTLLGSASAVGATLVAQSSAALNQALRQGAHAPPELVQQLGECLRTSVSRVKGVLAARGG